MEATASIALWVRIGQGLGLSGAIVALALARGALGRSGAAAALGLGTAIYLGGGLPWSAVLITFFVTSTGLARVGRARKEVTKREFDKGDERDAGQVFANGGVAALAALGMLVWPDPRWAGAFLGALATANGDTWATELGILSPGEPISLVRLRRVARGTSGAVSWLGLGASLAGAATVGGVAALAPAAFGLGASRAFIVSLLAGSLGALLDSVLGATVQQGFHCPRCRREVEAAVHHCGARATHLRGLRGFHNDRVNLVATLAGALVGGVLGAR